MAGTTWYINAYETRDVFGGPEEGGWWYVDGEPTGETWGPFGTLDEAHEQYSALDGHINLQNEGRWARHSSNGGDWYTVHIEDHLPRAFPEERPRYE